MLSSGVASRRLRRRDVTPRAVSASSSSPEVCVLCVAEACHTACGVGFVFLSRGLRPLRRGSSSCFLLGLRGSLFYMNHTARGALQWRRESAAPTSRCHTACGVGFVLLSRGLRPLRRGSMSHRVRCRLRLPLPRSASSASRKQLLLPPWPPRLSLLHESHRTRCSPVASRVGGSDVAMSHRVRCRLRLPLPRSRWPPRLVITPRAVFPVASRVAGCDVTTSHRARCRYSSTASADAVIVLASAARHLLASAAKSILILSGAGSSRRDGRDSARRRDGATVPRRAARFQGGAVVDRAEPDRHLASAAHRSGVDSALGASVAPRWRRAALFRQMPQRVGIVAADSDGTTAGTLSDIYKWHAHMIHTYTYTQYKHTHTNDHN